MRYLETSLFDEPEETAALTVYRGNRMEALIEIMASLLQKPLSSPFRKEVVVVQSKGMEQWVSLKLAEKLGVAANLSFLHPNTVIWQCCQLLFPALEGKEPIDNEYLTWKLMRLLPLVSDKEGFGELRHYLEGNDLLKRYQLSRRIADLFNRYTVFRPEMILNWEAGKGEIPLVPPLRTKGEEMDWQAKLWREIMKGERRIHYAFLRKMFLGEQGAKGNEALSPDSQLNTLPERINLFGVSSLPPFLVEFLRRLSCFTEVNFFLLNPCREFWFDISSKRDMARRASKKGNGVGFDEGQHLEEGNPLLASMGKVGRDLFTLCEELEFESIDCYLEPGEETLLARLQSDILNLRDRGQESRIIFRQLQDDNTVQVHSCHSPMREIEVLYDNLLSLIEQDPGIAPRDILVMAPDIETYTPYIKAVFEQPEEQGRKIPYAITDRTVKDERSVAALFLQLLEMPGSRFEAGKIINLLSFPLLRGSFGFSETDVAQIGVWIRDTRIYWGIDGKHRTSFDVPGFEENTWRAGLDRLLLGIAMPEKGELFEGVLPYGNIEGNETAILGNFIEFMEKLIAFCKEVERPKSLKGWVSILSNALDLFFSPTQREEADLLLIRRNLQKLFRFQESSEFSEAIGLDVVKACLTEELGSVRNEGGFITGRVTFCAMLPMRSVPFKVVYLLGMNEGVFPRTVRPLGFDLMAKSPKVGDRNPNSDDRYLFLEALLSARSHFLISYIGNDIRDNSEKQPSILVSELLEYIGREAGSEAFGSIFHRHPLQPFDERYFQDESAFFSYSRENFAAAIANSLRGKKGRVFSETSLPEAGDEWKEVDVKDFCAFFENPARFFLTKRLGVRFPETDEAVQECESFSLDSLDRYLVSQEMLETLETNGNLAQLEDILRAEGRLPHGEPGKLAFAELAEEVADFHQKLLKLEKGKPLSPVVVDIGIGSFRITGRIGNLFSNGFFLCRPAKVKVRDRLRAWLHLLLLECVQPDGCKPLAILLGKDGLYRYEAPEESRKHLEALLGMYLEGLSAPLCLIPESSLAFVEESMKGSEEEVCFAKARKVYEGNDFSVGLANDLWYRTAFEGIDPIAAAGFVETAQKLFKPLLEHESKC